MFSGGMKWEHWPGMGYITTVLSPYLEPCKTFFFFKNAAESR